MSMEFKPALLPWHLDAQGDLRGPNDEIIGDSLGNRYDWGLILRAVNAHDDLVAVIRELIAHPGSHNAAQAAKAALAKAGET